MSELDDIYILPDIIESDYNNINKNYFFKEYQRIIEYLFNNNITKKDFINIDGDGSFNRDIFKKLYESEHSKILNTIIVKKIDNNIYIGKYAIDEMLKVTSDDVLKKALYIIIDKYAKKVVKENINDVNTVDSTIEKTSNNITEKNIDYIDSLVDAGLDNHIDLKDKTVYENELAIIGIYYSKTYKDYFYHIVNFNRKHLESSIFGLILNRVDKIKVYKNIINSNDLDFEKNSNNLKTNIDIENSQSINALSVDTISDTSVYTARTNLLSYMIESYEYAIKNNIYVGKYLNSIKTLEDLSMFIKPKERDIDNILTSTSNLKPLDKTKFINYFKYDDMFYKNINGIEPADLTSNISFCMPFRYYYLPLLTEYKEHLRYKDWYYNYNPDEYEPFTYQQYNSQMDTESHLQKVSFTRKLTRKYRKDIISMFLDSLRTFAVFESGTKIKLDEHFGSISSQLLNGGSERIKFIIKRLVSSEGNLTPNIIRNKILLNEKVVKEDLTNLLVSELFFYFAVKATRILLLLDKDEEDAARLLIDKISKTKISLETDLDIIRKTDDPIIENKYLEEVRFIGLGIFGLSNIYNLQTERERIARKIHLMNIFQKNKPKFSKNKDDMEPYFGNVKTETNTFLESHNLLNLKKVANLFKIARGNFIKNAIFALKNTNTKFSYDYSNFIMGN